MRTRGKIAHVLTNRNFIKIKKIYGPAERDNVFC